MLNPIIIQGGMGVGVSSWGLARAVSKLGQLGVVSGTALDVVLSRRLQLGDPGGHMARAIAAFPFPEIARQVWDQYFIEGGKSKNAPFKLLPLHSINPPQNLTWLTVLANYVEVFLAKEGHSGVVGINFLEKIQLPTLPSIFGAMLAGVDYILMGAGIPRAIPGILDAFAAGQAAKLKIDVQDAPAGTEQATHFDPAKFCNGAAPKLNRPNFLAIISSATLALTLAKKSTGAVNGFIVEGITAGGHNAPPRGPMQLSENGEPVYGDRDVPDLEKIAAIGLPFWMAGSYASPEKLAEARAVGAAGIQVGSAFALCEESGIDPELRKRVIQNIREGKVEVFTDPVASPTGFPFKVLKMGETIADKKLYEARNRICDLGFLRHVYTKPDGSPGYRCPAEPVENYVRKGGCEAETEGRMCVCNGLMATAGLAQVQKDDYLEMPLLTAGDDVVRIAQRLKPEQTSYTAADVIDYLFSTPA